LATLVILATARASLELLDILFGDQGIFGIVESRFAQFLITSCMCW